jgi:AcrR family transcriptional regulator
VPVGPDLETTLQPFANWVGTIAGAIGHYASCQVRVADRPGPTLLETSAMDGDGDGLTRAERGERTRERMLEAGLLLLRNEPSELLFKQLAPEAIASRAGVSSGAFYHHFDDLDGFSMSLLGHALEQKPNPPFAAAVGGFEKTVAAGGTFLEGLMAGGAATLEYQETNATFALGLMVWARSHRDPQLRACLGRMYSIVQGDMVDYFGLILGALGRRIRPPYTAEQLAAVFIALYEGLTIRRAIDRDLVPLRLLGELLVPVLHLMTCPIDDEQTGPSWLAHNAPSWDAAPAG